MPLEEAISVVLSPFGYVIVDGHHDFMLSLYVEAETVPVKVVGDYSRLSPREFWQTLGDKKLSYLSRKPQTLSSRAPELSELVDTPNRYLAALLTAKFTIVGGKITHFKGNPKAVVWVKINDGVPFKEFEIAQVLSDAGIEYQDKWGDDVPKKIVTKSRNILTAAAEKLGIRVLTESEAKKIEKDKIQRLVCDLVY
jgi:hypothetical protein